MIEQFLPLLIEATERIPAHYFHLPVAGGEEAIYRERVYCYELYHQLRNLLEEDDELRDFVLSGEIDKRAHPIIERLCAPDFVFHVPGDMDNLVVLEVKPSNGEREGMLKDLETLRYFVSDAGYKLGIHLIYGDDDRAFEMIRREFLAADHERLQLYWHRHPGEGASRQE